MGLEQCSTQLHTASELPCESAPKLCCSLEHNLAAWAMQACIEDTA